MKHKILDEKGSFRAWGIGFYYEFDAGSDVLDIIGTRSKRPLVYLDLDIAVSKNPLGYVRFVEKAAQISALMYSCNQHIDLAEVVDKRRLPALLENATRIARYCYNLEREEFTDFKHSFAQDFSDVTLRFKKIAGSAHSLPFYSADIETTAGSVIRSRATKMHRILDELAGKVIHDLIAGDCNSHSPAAVDSLLKVSGELSALSCTLDDGFVPIKKIVNRSPLRRIIRDDTKKHEKNLLKQSLTGGV